MKIPNYDDTKMFPHTEEEQRLKDLARTRFLIRDNRMVGTLETLVGLGLVSIGPLTYSSVIDIAAQQEGLNGGRMLALYGISVIGLACAGTKVVYDGIQNFLDNRFRKQWFKKQLKELESLTDQEKHKPISYYFNRVPKAPCQGERK